MFYINQRVGRRYEVIDTSNGESKLCYKKDLKELIEGGIHINGAIIYEDKVIVRPVGYLINLTKKDMAKNKIALGSSTGIIGFDIGLDEDKLVALPLKPEFLSYARSEVKDGIFILQIPEIVTDIDNNFLMYTLSLAHFIQDVRLYIELPSSMTSLSSNSIGSNSVVYKVHFNNKIDKLYSNHTALLSRVPSSALVEDTNNPYLTARVIGFHTLALRGTDTLYLPDIEVLEKDSIYVESPFKFCKIYLGKSITTIENFHLISSGKFSSSFGGAYMVTKLSKDLSRFLMNNTCVVFLSSNCSLRRIDLHQDSSELVTYGSYIFIMSEDEFQRLKGVISQANIGSNTVLGVLCYRSSTELMRIQDYIDCYTRHYSMYFSNYFQEDDLGKIKMLKLKNL